jgi:hypothetical protein
MMPSPSPSKMAKDHHLVHTINHDGGATSDKLKVILICR